MDPKRIRALLEQVQGGKLPIDGALEQLARLPADDLGHSLVDHHRGLRTGHAEVIYGQGKSAEEILSIAQSLRQAGQNVLATRVSANIAEAVCAQLADATYHPRSRVLTQTPFPIPRLGKGTIAIVSAGTSDGAVAEEAALTAAAFGNDVQTIRDVGVAGLHRLLPHLDALRSARVLIVVAGMEGALPSVIGGLVQTPVIAVPTSVGYGAAFQGLSALLGMLNSCASGITVVNIDNGFGAAYAASQINRLD